MIDDLIKLINSVTSIEDFNKFKETIINKIEDIRYETEDLESDLKFYTKQCDYLELEVSHLEDELMSANDKEIEW